MYDLQSFTAVNAAKPVVSEHLPSTTLTKVVLDGLVILHAHGSAALHDLELVAASLYLQSVSLE